MSGQAAGPCSQPPLPQATSPGRSCCPDLWQEMSRAQQPPHPQTLPTPACSGGSYFCILQFGLHSTDVWGHPPLPLPLFLSAWPSPARVSADPTGEEGGPCQSSGPPTQPWTRPSLAGHEHRAWAAAAGTPLWRGLSVIMAPLATGLWSLPVTGMTGTGLPGLARPLVLAGSRLRC